MKSAISFFISISIFFCFLINSVYAQQLQWARKLGGTGGEEGRGIVVDKNGNVYTTGTFQGTTDFDPGTGVYNLVSDAGTDVFVSKVDENGFFKWARSFGGGGNTYDFGFSITTDNQSNVYIIGQFSGTVDFDPGIGIDTITGSGDAFVWKLDQMGNFCWAKTFAGLGYGGNGGDVEGKSIALDPLGNIYLTGSFNGNVDFNPGVGIDTLIAPNGNTDAFITKLNSNGDFVWARNIGGSDSDHARSIAVDDNGNAFITGWFVLNVDFDPGPGVNNFTSGSTFPDSYILKLDYLGNFKWVKTFGGSNFDRGFCIVLDASGNIYSKGKYTATADLDPGPGISNYTAVGAEGSYISKLDSNGNFLWAKTVYEQENYNGASHLGVDEEGNVYSAGHFQGTVDFDPGVQTNNLISAGNYDVFIFSLDSSGNYRWAKSIGQSLVDRSNSIFLDNKRNIYVTGMFLNTIDCDPTSNVENLISTGGSEVFLAKFSQKGVIGKIYHDINGNCLQGNNDIGLVGRRVVIDPGSVIVETNASGRWYIDSLPVGNYIINVDTSGNWTAACVGNDNFTVVNPDSAILVSNLGIINTHPCAQHDVSITAPFLRRCFSNQTIYVQACNQNVATTALNSAYVDVKLDSLLTPTSSSLSYTSMGNNKYRFNVGNLNPGQCVNFTINTTVSCNAILNQTLCIEASLYPADSCVFDTIPSTPIPGDTVSVTPCTLPWDHSSLSVDGWCANDTVYFTVTNNGIAVNGNMQCYAPVRVYVDGVLTYVDSILLSGGQTITYSYPGNGQTWILQADQHPLHPGNSHPNAHVEACGNIANWTPNLINNLPLDDADPVVDIYCGVVSGAYDPNDKTGFPIGLGTQHEILPNQQIQYLIRFQNTGTDTAFNIVVRDTLDTDLNIFSVVPGAASHNYTFRMYGPRVLEWTFTNIMLPDSNVNEATSHGFLTFRVDQQPNLPNGTTILNDADIYFDFNDPIITNQTLHTINNQLHNFAVGLKSEVKNQKSQIKVYPNPASNNVTILLTKENVGSTYNITNQLGQTILQGKLTTEQNLIDINNLATGFYVVTVEGKEIKQSVKLVKQ